MPARLRARRTPAALVAGAVVAALAGAGLTALPGSASAAVDLTPGYYKRAVTVDVMTGPDADIPCTIAADIYTPDGATPRHKVPAILTSNGFGGAKDNAEQKSYAQGFAMAGYLVMTYSGLGFGGSTCKISLDDPRYDGRAGKQLVDVLAGKRDYTVVASGKKLRVRNVAQEAPGDPRVGMIGGSYGGQIQYAIASQDTRVDALIPMFTWNNLAYSLAPNNTGFSGGVTYTNPGVYKRVWTNGFFSVGVQNGFTQFQSDPTRVVGCPNFRDDVCAAKAQLDSQGYPSASTLDLARNASVHSYTDKIRIPTLVVQGQADTLFNLQESVATFKALRARGVESRLIWQSFGHSVSTPVPGEFSKAGTNVRLTDTYLGRRFLAWMNHYVRGNRTAPVGPRFSYYRDWVRTDPKAKDQAAQIAKTYASASSFSQAATETLYLSGADALTPDASKVQAGSAQYANASGAPTSYSELSAVDQSQPVSDGQGTFASWTSPALTAPLDVVGSPRVTLHLDAPAAAGTQAAGPDGQLVLFVKLYDVAPNGTETLWHRLISPVRVPDVTKPLTVQLPGVVQRFAKGHQVRLVVAASDVSYEGNKSPQPVTISTSPDAPGVLRLPARTAMRF